jgi:hypothetical protein
VSLDEAMNCFQLEGTRVYRQRALPRWLK